MSVGLLAEGWSGHLGKKVKLEVEQGDQRQAGWHGAISEFGKRIIEIKDRSCPKVGGKLAGGVIS